jgi:hypothetical protein
MLFVPGLIVDDEVDNSQKDKTGRGCPNDDFGNQLAAIQKRGGSRSGRDGAEQSEREQRSKPFHLCCSELANIAVRSGFDEYSQWIETPWQNNLDLDETPFGAPGNRLCGTQWRVS